MLISGDQQLLRLMNRMALVRFQLTRPITMQASRGVKA